MTDQLTLDIASQPIVERDFFLTDASNEEAFNLCDGTAEWPNAHLFLIGPPKSGKSLLAETARTNGIDVCEDLDKRFAGYKKDAIGQEAFERDLFHRMNWATENKGRMLVTASKAAVFLPITMPDLRSRLMAAPTTTISQPSDNLLRKLLAKHFSDRQVQIESNVLAFLVTRIERSHADAFDVAVKIDKAALQAKKRVTIAFAKQVLTED